MSGCLFSLLLLVPAAEPTSGLGERLLPLIRAHQGRVAVGVKCLTTGETWYHHADAVMPTASLIKVAVLAEAYLQADEGKIDLRDPVMLRDEDRVPGSGILTTHFSAGVRLPLRDLARLMIALSDNTATNLVLDRVGIAAVNRRMAGWGLKETRINAQVFRGSTTSVDPERTRRYGLGSTTAREMVALFERVQTNDGFRPAVKLAMLEHLRRNDDRDKFPRLLPPGIALAHKDGAVSDARTDAGILYLPRGAVVLCVLTADNKDRRWSRDNAGTLLCARLARAVHDYFVDPAPAVRPGAGRLSNPQGTR